MSSLQVLQEELHKELDNIGTVHSDPLKTSMIREAIAKQLIVVEAIIELQEQVKELNASSPSSL